MIICNYIIDKGGDKVMKLTKTLLKNIDNKDIIAYNVKFNNGFEVEILNWYANSHVGAHTHAIKLKEAYLSRHSTYCKHASSWSTIEAN